MRTTLDIDEDVLRAARQLAREQNVSLGKALSTLARQALVRQVELAARNGVPLFPRPADAKVVTLELINELRDERP
ncbi:MAG: CopG family transcriptional regulator [Candidatus Promineifilaceae bacterium]